MNALVASIFSDFWNDQLVDDGRQYLFLVLAGFILSFGFIRFSTRMMRSPRVPWWPGSIVSDGGVHLHHLVFGIVMMIAAGTISFAGFATDPIYGICAVTFGIGVGLTIDEFALWVYLDDVYWAKQGRASIDATLLAAALMLIALVGIQPVEFDTASAAEIIASIVAILILFTVVAISFLKGRLVHGSIGIFIQPLAIYAACRIGKPGSGWGRRFYGERNPKKQAKAEHRFQPDRRTERFKEQLRDAVGGSPEEEYEAKIAAREQPREVVAEVRSRADSKVEAESTESDL